MNKLQRYKYILGFIALGGITACTDDLVTDAPSMGGDKGLGEMVLFTAGRTNSLLTTRADDNGDGGDGNKDPDNYSETPGEIYYMPDAYRFVCRMYYKAQAASDEFDVSSNTKNVAWLKVSGNVGNSLYWNNQYNNVGTNEGEGGVDGYGNDYAANMFYWQNRSEHAFLAWTDLNKARDIKYANRQGYLKMDGDMTYEEHTGIKTHQSVLSGFQISGIPDRYKDIDRNFANYVLNNYNSLKDEEQQKSDIESIPATYQYDPDRIDWYNRPLNNVRYSYMSGTRHDEKYADGEPETEDNIVSYFRGPILLWVWGEGQEAIYDFSDTNGDIVDTENPEANGDCWVYNQDVKVALRKKIYVDAGTDGAQSEDVPAPTPENPDAKETKYFVYKYLATWPSGLFHYDFTQQPAATVAIHKYFEVKETETIKEYNVNQFDLTRGTKSSIKEQPDICQAFKIQKPEYATQTLNRVNLIFKHKFSQIQVNLRASSDNSVTLDAGDIQKVELLGVSEEGYVFNELYKDDEGEYKVHPAAYKDVVISDYSEAELALNEYGTSFEMFDMRTGKDADGYTVGTTGAGPDAGYPIGYLKSYNGITFGQLKAIRITWKEKGTNISHEATMKVTDQRLSALKSGFKYIWNVELRRGTLATLRVDIEDWIVPNNELKYETNGTISD